jgi:NAD(P)-dependent dehydrogenase (short-subunit alcohol dehydrogenase family)
MERTLLITDGDTALGCELIRLFSFKGWRVATTSSPESRDIPGSPAAKADLVIPWNRRSPVSARNILVTALNTFPSIDEALVLDVPRASAVPVHELPSSEIEKAFDYFLKPTVFLVRELLSHFLQAQRGLLALVSFSTRPQDGYVPALERAIREGFKGFATSLIDAYVDSGLTVNAFQSFGVTPEEFALFIEKTMEEKGRKISGRWFTCQPKGGLFQGKIGTQRARG